MYLSREYKTAKERSEKWSTYADGVTVFVRNNSCHKLYCSHPRDGDQAGLFSVVLVTFLLISYPLLQPDPADTTNQLLAINNQLLTQIYQQSPSNGTGSLQPLSLANDSSFHPPNYAVRVNALWIASLYLSVVCALWATLLQQWARSFLRTANRQDRDSKHTPSQHALIYSSFLYGMKHLKLPVAAEALPVLLHTSVFLFNVGLIDLFFNVKPTIAYVWLAFFAIESFIYLIATFMPLFYHNSPYFTPVSTLFWYIIKAASLLWLCLSKQDTSKVRDEIRMGMRSALESKAIEPTKKTGLLRAEAEINVLKSMMKSLDEDQEFEDFLDGLPGLFQDSNTDYLKNLGEGLLKSVRVEQVTDKLFATCTATGLLPEALRSQRLTACLRAVWCFHDTIDRHFRAIWEQWDKVTDDPWGSLSMETWAEASSMTKNSDQFIAVRAHCIEALMAVMWKKGRWQCISPKGRAKVTELLKCQLEVPSLDVGWLTNGDQLQLAVAANLLSKLLDLLDRKGTDADTTLKTKLKEILDSICRELDVSDVQPELQDRFADGARVMKVFNIQDVDPSFGRAASAFGPCAKIVK